MTQFSMEDYLTNEEKTEMDVVTEKEKVTERNIENDNDSNGIVEVRYGNEIYKTWKVEFIRPFLFKFLKEKYPYSLIVRELNDIDFTLFDDKTDIIIPIEVQKIILNIKTFAHTHFEKAIRKQIDDNIESYEKCWFFFDMEYLRFLQSGNIKKSINIDMTWLINYMKEEKLKVFAIRYDGLVKELTTKDFEFLINISQLCIHGYKNDERVINRNKLKIYKNVVYGHGFNQREINEFYRRYDEYRKADIEHDCHDSAIFFTRSDNKRCKLYGNILIAIRSILKVNSCLSMSDDDRHNRYYAISMGIFDDVGKHGYAKLIKFVDKFDVCKYFPGYMRNKGQWDRYKGNNLTYETYSMIVSGAYKYAKTMFDY